MTITSLNLSTIKFLALVAAFLAQATAAANQYIGNGFSIPCFLAKLARAGLPLTPNFFIAKILSSGVGSLTSLNIPSSTPSSG